MSTRKIEMIAWNNYVDERMIDKYFTKLANKPYDCSWTVNQGARKILNPMIMSLGYGLRELLRSQHGN